jgi:cytochrome c oxidase cbb3-type subunit 4
MVSGITTLVLIALFLGGWAWAWSPRRKADFEAAARQPLEDAANPAKEIRQ